MNRLFDRLLAYYGCGLLLVAACVAPLVRAQDAPPCPPPTEKSGEVLILRQCTGDDPACGRQTIVVGRLHLEPGEIIDTRELSNIEHRVKGLQFLFGQPQVFVGQQPGQTIEAGLKFTRLGCACAAAGECECGKKAAAQVCGSDCVAHDCPCTAVGEVCPCTAQEHNSAHAQETKCGEECQEKDVVKDVLVRHHLRHVEEAVEHHPLRLMQHIAGLVGEKAAAEAALEVRKQADEQIGEIYEAMSELLADNAALDARLEAQAQAHAEQRKLLEKVAELATENARLKTHIELAAERAEVARQSVALTLENERLKLRLTEVEQKHTLAEAIRTSAKPKERKAR